MKKLSVIFLFIFFLFSIACAEEALMWTSQSDPVIHAAEGYKDTSPVYENPKQYLLQLRPLAFPASLNAMLSADYGPISIEQEHHELVIKPSHSYFGQSAHQICSVSFPGEDDLPVSFCFADEQPIVQQLQELLKSVGWVEACDPDMFCTARQVVQRGTSPIDNGKFHVDSIPEDLWDSFYFLHFMQEIDGYPLEIWIENANEDEFETRDAAFVLDSDGRIVTGRIFPGYEVVGKADLSGRTLTAYEAGERFLKFMLYRYEWTKSWDGLEEYECSWEITGFHPGLVLTHTGAALPCWQIEYRQILTNMVTGERFQNDRTYSINALTGAG